MKLVQKIAAGLLLSWGFFCLMVAISEVPILVNKDATPKDKTKASDTMVGGLAFGLPSLAAGTWLVWHLYQKGQQEIRDRLQSIFFRLVEEGNGRLTLLRFAKETQLSGEKARQFLDEKAQEFNGTFETDDRGGISYYFNL